jgi:hypothetical protein
MGLDYNLEGIVLGERTRWVVNGVRDYETYFRNVDHLLPTSQAILYLEGVAIAPEVRSFIEKHATAPVHKVYPGTVWPKPSVFHLPATAEVLRGLAELAHDRPTLEMADHCHFYTSQGMVLQWYDALDDDCPLGVGPEISEDRLQEFCRRAGATYTEYKSR